LKKKVREFGQEIICGEEGGGAVKFLMRATLELSGKIKDREAVKDFLEEARDSLKKGVPKGEKGAEIKDIKIGEDRIALTIESGRHVRPHDGILRIKKRISERLGRDQGIGVRGLSIENYEVWYPLEKVPIKEITLPFVREIQIKDRTAHLVFEDMDEAALEQRHVDRILRRLDEKISEEEIGGKEEFSRTIRKSEGRLNKYSLKKDPTAELIKRNWVKHIGRGVWTILPAYAALWRAIENLVMDRIAKPLGFVEVMLPKIVPLDVQKKKGQLFGIPNEMWWVCPPATRDPKEWENFKDLIKITGQTNSKGLMENLSSPEFSLAYAQCEPFYDIWERRTVDRDKLPLKFIDSYGPTWRYESGGLKGLERLSEFKRMEFVWIGSPEDAIKIRDNVRDRSVEIMDKIFDVEWRVDATTAVYLEHAGEKVAGEDRDYIRTYDLSVSLPFETISLPEKDLEIASFHVHEDHYAKNFYWKEKKGRTLWSGCAGISPTRWAYVFLLRHGFDYDRWPKEIKAEIGEKLPELPKNLFM
jgi:seryl-tRNA synthetase